ncbi:MAG: CBS domain-containing protein [Candidatus Aenigmarchaeota archaeon]|nr:CBS domain-containing protein [Candidatus Aenigmarchaeota archaeon]
MKVKEVMHSITKLPSHTTIVDAAIAMDKKTIGSILVEENCETIGIVTERDILRKIVAKGRDPSKVAIKEIASNPLITVDENATLAEASEKMAKQNIRRLVVTSGNKIVGVITTRDVSNNVNYLLAKGATAYLPSYYP